MWVDDLKIGDRFVSIASVKGAVLDGDEDEYETGPNTIGVILGVEDNPEGISYGVAFEAGLTAYIDQQDMRDPGQYQKCGTTYVIYSPDQDSEDGQFWSNHFGWTDLPFADRFLVPEGNLPTAGGQRAEWALDDEARKLISIPKALMPPSP